MTTENTARRPQSLSTSIHLVYSRNWTQNSPQNRPRTTIAAAPPQPSSRVLLQPSSSYALSPRAPTPRALTPRQTRLQATRDRRNRNVTLACAAVAGPVLWLGHALLVATHAL